MEVTNSKKNSSATNRRIDQGKQGERHTVNTPLKLTNGFSPMEVIEAEQLVDKEDSHMQGNKETEVLVMSVGKEQPGGPILTKYKPLPLSKSSNTVKLSQKSHKKTKNNKIKKSKIGTLKKSKKGKKNKRVELPEQLEEQMCTTGYELAMRSSSKS